MDSALLVGLWELEGFSKDPYEKVIVPPLGTRDSEVREFLYFASDGTFFFVKFAEGIPLTFDSITERLVSDPPIEPALHGTWKMEGNELVEQATDREGGTYENRFELAELTNTRVIIMEPTRNSAQRLGVVYTRNDVERFPAPTLKDDGKVEETDNDVYSATAAIQREQQTIGALVAAQKLNSAHRLAQRSVQHSTRVFGSEHPNTAACLSTLGAVLAKLDQGAAGIIELERSFKIYSASRNVDPLALANVLNNLSLAYTTNEQFRLALATAVPAVRFRAEALGFGSEATLVSIQNLARALSSLGYLGFALECYRAQEALSFSAGLSHKQAAAQGNREALEKRTATGFQFKSEFRDERLDLKSEPAILRVLAEAEQLIVSGPDANDAFVLEYAQAADPMSYFHLVHKIKSAQAMLAEDKGKEAAVSLLRAQVRVVQACDVPLTHFKGMVERIQRSSLGPIGICTLYHAFPNFDADQERKAGLHKMLEPILGPNQPESFAERQVRRAESQGYVVSLASQQFRRFAGAQNFPRQRYAALYSDQGPDATLARELFEYTNPQIPGAVFVGSTCDSELMSAGKTLGLPNIAAGRAGIFVFLLPPTEAAERDVYLKVFRPILDQLHGPYGDGNDAWTSLSIVFIPVKSETVDLARVLDLRQRAAQDWFFYFFRCGDGAVFQKDISVNIERFHDMLPALVYPEFGGSGFNKSVGSWLRTVGINGLVYPSARSDAGVSYDAEGKAAAWQGWNLVDYRNLTFVPDNLVHADNNPWSGFVAARQAAPKLEMTDRGWCIRGAEDRYQMFRQGFLQLLSNPKTRILPKAIIQKPSG